jgi:hypothetical protein
MKGEISPQLNERGDFFGRATVSVEVNATGWNRVLAKQTEQGVGGFEAVNRDGQIPRSGLLQLPSEGVALRIERRFRESLVQADFTDGAGSGGQCRLKLVLPVVRRVVQLTGMQADGCSGSGVVPGEPEDFRPILG